MICMFGEIMAGLDSMSVKIIASMASEGPAMLESYERRAYDYNMKSEYVDSCSLCPSLSDISGPYSACAPSVLQWKKHVLSVYSSIDDATLKQAFAEIVVCEYAERYGNKVSGFWFDQGLQADMARLHDVVRMYNHKAAVTFDHCQRLPLTNNNGPYMDYTSGYPHMDLQEYPGLDCVNYSAIP